MLCRKLLLVLFCFLGTAFFNILPAAPAAYKTHPRDARPELGQRDNYSLTAAGNTRPLHPLSALQLFSKTGEAEWLTASYANKCGSMVNWFYIGLDFDVKCNKEILYEERKL